MAGSINLSPARYENIAQACSVIERDLAQSHPIGDLARDAGMAPHHFQRCFAAATGETVAGYVRSRRLERAAILLENTDARVIEIALDCGFETHAALTRAFGEHFGVSPSVFRRDGLDETNKAALPRPFLKPVEAKSIRPHFDLVEMPAQWLCWRKAAGMVEGRYFPDLAATRRAFAELANELDGARAAYASCYAEGPAAFEDQSAEVYFGALLQQRRELDWAQGWSSIEPGSHAVFGHYGPLTTIHLTWHRAARVVLGRAGLRLRSSWMTEVYLDDVSAAPANVLTALIYLPVEKKHVRESA